MAGFTRLLVLLAAWVGMARGTALAGTCSDGTVCDADISVYDASSWATELTDVIGDALDANESAVICLDRGPFGSAFSLDYPGADITLCTADTSAPVELGALEIGSLDTVGEQGLRSLRLRDVQLAGNVYGVLVASDVERLDLENVVMTPGGGLNAHGIFVEEGGPLEIHVSNVRVEGQGVDLLWTKHDTTIVLDDSNPDGPALTMDHGTSTVPLFSADESTGVAPSLELKGSLQRNLGTVRARALAGTEFAPFRSVHLEDLTVEGYDCEVCVTATEIHGRNTTWMLGTDASGTPADTGFWLRATGVEPITLANVTFRTEGAPWTLAKGTSLQALGLEYCAAGGWTSGTDGLLTVSRSANLWNSTVVMGSGSMPLTMDTASEIRLRGTTVVTGIVDGTLVPEDKVLEATNTLLVGGSAPATDALPGAARDWPAHVRLTTDISDVFSSPQDVLRCDTAPLPDTAWTGTRGRGVKEMDVPDRSVEMLGVSASRELSDLFEQSAASGVELEDPGDTWCDPDGSWPDVGAWSGPWSPEALDPGIATGDLVPCEGPRPDTGGTDGADTGDGIGGTRITWGGTCNACQGSRAVGILPLLGFWWGRRRRKDAA